MCSKNERLARQIGAETEQFHTSSWRFVAKHDEDEVKTWDTVSETKTKSLPCSDHPQRDAQRDAENSPTQFE